jgi:hydroxymethylpyrimidine/phosphomethylpyrimidine kinase
MRTVLTIAGFDPSSGAGVTADLMIFAAHSLFGTACITALTVQSTLGVVASHPVDATIIEATLDCLTADLPPVGIKIGMLANTDIIRTISMFCIKYRALHSFASSTAQAPVVLDPVLKSSSGRELIEPAGIQALRDDLLPQVDWVTPNLDELEILSGEPVAARDDIPNACRVLQAKVAAKRKGNPLGVIATGGHLDPPDDFILMPGGETVWLRGERIITRSTHGTGCAFSSALLSQLVLGEDGVEAARAAKQYVAGAMRTGTPRGGGASAMNLLWPIYETKTSPRR